MERLFDSARTYFGKKDQELEDFKGFRPQVLKNLQKGGF